MYKFILIFWKKLNLISKLLIVLSVFLISAIFYLKTKYSFYEIKYVNELQNQREKLQDSLHTSNLRILDLTQKGQIKTVIIRQNLSKIDKKLKADENKIDNDTITDDDIRSFITNNKQR